MGVVWWWLEGPILTRVFVGGVCWWCLLWVLLRYKDEQDRNETLQLNQVRKEERLELDMKEKNNRNLQQVAREYNSLLEIAKGHTQALGKRGREVVVVVGEMRVVD